MKLNKRLQDAYGQGPNQKNDQNQGQKPDQGKTPAGSRDDKAAGSRPAAGTGSGRGTGPVSGPNGPARASSPPPAANGPAADGRGFVMTGMDGETFLKLISRGDDGEKPSLREIAGLLMIMGKDQAARIMALLPDDLVEKISLEISRIRVLKPEESKAIIQRFHLAAVREQQRLRGGRDFARDVLEKSLGRKKAAEVLEKAGGSSGVDQLAFLNDLEAAQIRHLIKDEPPRLIGIILSHLDAARAAALIREMPDEIKPQVIRSMGKRVKLSQDVLHSIAKALKGKIRRIGTQQSEYIDGPQILAEILRSMDASAERNLLETLGLEAPDVESQIKERLFTIDRVLHIRDHDLQRILADMRDEEIALLMKGKDESIRLRLLKNVSSQRGMAISEVYHYLGPIPRKDVDQATRDFIIRLRMMEEKGELTIPREGDEFI